MGSTYLGCPQHPPAAIVTWPGQGTRTALAQGASFPLLQEVPSVLSQQELIPGGCGQLWGSLCLPGEPPSTPCPPCSPSVSCAYCPQPSPGSHKISCPQGKQWPPTGPQVGHPLWGTALLPLTWVQVKCCGYRVHLHRAALGCPPNLWGVPRIFGMSPKALGCPQPSPRARRKMLGHPPPWDRHSLSAPGPLSAIPHLSTFAFSFLKR